MKQKQQTPNEANVLAKDNKNQQLKRHEVIMKPSKPSNTNSGPQRPAKQSVEQKVNNESKLQQKTDKVASQRKPLSGQQDVSVQTYSSFESMTTIFWLTLPIVQLEIQVFRWSCCPDETWSHKKETPGALSTSWEGLVSSLSKFTYILCLNFKFSMVMVIWLEKI